MLPHSKRGKRNKQSAGHYCCVCYSAAAAVKAMECYLNLDGESEMSEAFFEGEFEYRIHKAWGIPIIK
ncbi:MAG: hypothetical protein J6D08_14490 [Lachnospiraceae bacterium]|nr:hypothetical protein [Lachnospiraceae bacterium]